jgi:uncharacterized membrane protein
MGLKRSPSRMLEKSSAEASVDRSAVLSMTANQRKVCNERTGILEVMAVNVDDSRQIVQPTNRFAWHILIHGIIGWLGAAMLTYERVHLWFNPNSTLSCDVNGFISCKAVMLQKQASVFGFPNSFVGLVGFLAPIALGIATLLGYRYSRALWRVFFAGIGMAFVFALWLFSQSVFVINILCPYCIVVWAGTLPLFFRVFSFGIHEGFLDAPKWLEKRKESFYEWAWVWALVLELVVACVIAIVFFKQWVLLIPAA